MFYLCDSTKNAKHTTSKYFRKMSNKFHKSIKKRIFQPHWHITRPMGIISESDAYYLGLSNKIHAIIDSMGADDIISDKSIRDISIKVACYFEDVISGFGLWKAFVNIHLKMYGKYLPFYEINEAEYYDDEINLEDVTFLVWSELQRYDIDNEVHRFLNPENPFITMMSLKIYELLDSEFETAPENTSVFKYIHTLNHIDDYVSARYLLGWLHYDSYLSMSYPRISLKKEVDDLKSQKKDDFYRENFEILKYASEKTGIFSKTCSPLAIKAKDWLAQIFVGSPNAEIFKSIDFKQINNYNIIDSDTEAETFTITNAEEEVFVVTLDSLSNPPSFKSKKSIMCALVFFNGLWHVNGFASFSSQDIDIESDDTLLSTNANNKQTYEYVLKYVPKPISYYKSSKELLNILEKIFPDAKKKDILPADFLTFSNFVMFVHPDFGLSFYPNLAQHITDPQNRCYDKDVNETEGLGVLTGYYKLPKQLLEYLINNNLLQGIYLKSVNGKVYGKKQLQENIEFVVRFFQPNLYN